MKSQNDWPIKLTLCKNVIYVSDTEPIVKFIRTIDLTFVGDRATGNFNNKI